MSALGAFQLRLTFNRYVFALSYYYRLVDTYFLILPPLFVSVASRPVEVLPIMESLFLTQLAASILYFQYLALLLDSLSHAGLQNRVELATILLVHSPPEFCFADESSVSAVAGLERLRLD